MPFSYEQRFMYKDRDYTYVYNPNDDGSTSGIYLHKFKLGFKLKNHRVVKIERLDSRHVYDIKLGDVHNFALTSGIIVHNCGALWNASQHAEEYGYEYGENAEVFTEFNLVSSTDEMTEFELQLMSRNRTHAERTADYEQFGINPPEDFDVGVSDGVFI